MSKIETITQLYRKKGVTKLGREVCFYLTAQGPFATILRSTFGELCHEKIIMYIRLGYRPQIKNPRSFNEKIAYRKHFTDNEMYSKVSDKYEVREYVKEKVNDKYLNELYYITDDPSDIPFSKLPKKFVIKPTHGSGWTMIITDKEQADAESIRSRCEEWMSKTYGEDTGEYWYEQIKPRIMIEKYLESNEFENLPDFKFFVFNGSVEVIEVDFNRFSRHTQQFYNTDWESLNFSRQYPKGPDIDKPEEIEEMISISEKIGSDFDFARVDLYITRKNGIKFGEMTLAPASGWGSFSPTEYDFLLGSYWEM